MSTSDNSSSVSPSYHPLVSLSLTKILIGCYIGTLRQSPAQQYSPTW
uniref:Uncharacterized protein n=1 Tax=Anguilla anguilla TaxID=7936 RepID=A0A0E9T283_ANGAN